MNVGDKFVLVEDIEYEDLRSISYSDENIDAIFDDLEDNGPLEITLIQENKRNPDNSSVYYFNKELGSNCYFRKWMVEIVEIKHKGHCLTSQFKH